MIFKILDKTGDTVEVIEDIDLAADFFAKVTDEGKWVIGVAPDGTKHALNEFNPNMTEMQVMPRMVGG